MGVYIKEMDKPKRCEKCPIMRYYYETGTVWCNALHLSVAIIPYENRLFDSALNEIEPHEDCPLVEIKTPHGRLIDADEMIKDIRRWENHPDTYIRNRNKDFIYYLENSNTVIEAEGE